MNCFESQQRLQRFLDGETGDDPVWHLHLSRCASCRALHQGARMMQNELNNQPLIMVPAALTDSIVRRGAEQLRPRILTRGRVAGLMALAASILLVFVLTRPGAKKTVSTGGGIVVSPTPTPRMVYEKAQTNVTRWIKIRTEKDIKPLVPKISVSPPPMSDPQVYGVAQVTKPLSDTGEGLKEGIAPVTKSAGQAFRFFMNKLPTFRKRN